VRVVAGELRGRRLHAPRGTRTRPTADRVREAIFSILGDVRGTFVLDLFCGTGALAIEALSRGADRALLVDRELGTSRRNVEELGLSTRAELVRSDAIKFLSRSASAKYDLVFCDPPYELADRIGNDIGRLLPSHLARGARVICESAARSPLRLELPLESEHRYGDTFVAVHRAKGD
jgi:16S rRNA (guanine966-N2)-methyltransferase